MGRQQPLELVAGRNFEDKVKADFKAREDVDTEYRLVDSSGRTGRADIWIVYDRSDTGEPVATAIFEVKNKNWNTTNPLRIRPNVLRVARQLWRYINAAVDVQRQTVQAFVIFPSVPSDIYVQRAIEIVFAERGIVVLWWEEQTTTPFELMDAATEGGPEVMTLLMSLADDLLSDDGVVPETPEWLPRACAAGHFRRSAMGPINWEVLQVDALMRLLCSAWRLK